MKQQIEHRAEVDAALDGLRLDQALARLYPDYSRSRLQGWIAEGAVRVDGQPARRARDKVQTGAVLELAAELAEQGSCAAQPIPLDIRFEDEHLLVLHKPAGLVVHPAAGNPDRTLQNALLHHQPALELLPRAGIVHRLDKETSGLMVVAKSLPAHRHLVDALQRREIERRYLALVQGDMPAGGTVDAPIGRHPRQRTRMAVVGSGKPARTHYRVRAHYPGHCLLEVKLESGRTHQIRVHMAHVRHPIVGDPVYGGRLRLPPKADEGLIAALRGFRRQALHAFALALQHPVSGEPLSWEAEPPQDMQRLIAAFAGGAAST